MILVFWMLSFKPTFSLSSFTFIKRLFSSSSLSAIRVVSSAYLRLLIFLPAILIPACASSSPAFLLMYSAYKLNKQSDNTPFPIWKRSISYLAYSFSYLEPVCCSMSSSNCCFLTCIQITSWQIDGETVAIFIFEGSKITADGDCSHEIKRCLLFGRQVMINLDSLLKSRGVTLPTKVHLVKAMVFSSSRVWMWELDSKESWVPKNWWFWSMVLEKTLESPLDCKEIQPIHP